MWLDLLKWIGSWFKTHDSRRADFDAVVTQYEGLTDQLREQCDWLIKQDRRKTLRIQKLEEHVVKCDDELINAKHEIAQLKLRIGDDETRLSELEECIERLREWKHSVDNTQHVNGLKNEIKRLGDSSLG